MLHFLVCVNRVPLINVRLLSHCIRDLSELEEVSRSSIRVSPRLIIYQTWLETSDFWSREQTAPALSLPS